MSNLTFRRLTAEAQLPKGNRFFAHIINERGLPSKTILPPHATRSISTGLELQPPLLETDGKWSVLVTSYRGLLLHSIFAIPSVVERPGGEICIDLYNGGISTYYIVHNQFIAEFTLIRTTPPKTFEFKDDSNLAPKRPKAVPN